MLAAYPSAIAQVQRRCVLNVQIPRASPFTATTAAEPIDNKETPTPQVSVIALWGVQVLVDLL